MNNKIISTLVEMAYNESNTPDGMYHVGCSLCVNGEYDSMSMLWSLTDNDHVDVIPLDVPEGTITQYIWTYWKFSDVWDGGVETLNRWLYPSKKGGKYV